MTATERLLILGTAATYQPDERVEARRLVQEGIDWELFCELAEVNATGPLVWRNLAELNLADRVPADIRARFEERAQAIREANEARLKNARDLFARFAARQIPVVILKGVLFAETIYRDPDYKKMNDVDILIRRRDLDAIYDIYEEMRLFSAAELVAAHRASRKNSRITRRRSSAVTSSSWSGRTGASLLLSRLIRSITTPSGRASSTSTFTAIRRRRWRPRTTCTTCACIFLITNAACASWRTSPISFAIIRSIGTCLPPR